MLIACTIQLVLTRHVSRANGYATCKHASEYGSVEADVTVMPLCYQRYSAGVASPPELIEGNSAVCYETRSHIHHVDSDSVSVIVGLRHVSIVSVYTFVVIYPCGIHRFIIIIIIN
jgi:hypothetical protein